MRADKRYLMGRILAAFCIMMQLTLLSSVLVYADEYPAYEVRIVDDEDLLTDEEEDELYEVMLPLSAYGHVAFYSTSSADAEATIRETSYNWFNNASSTLFMIDMGTRMIKLANTGDIYDRINKNYMNLITDNVYTYATKGDYLGCAAKAYEQELSLMEGGRIAQPMRFITNILTALVLGLLINFIYVWIKKGKTSLSDEERITAAAGAAAAMAMTTTLMHERKTRHVSSSSGGGGGSFRSSGGGGFSGGGGGFSGGTGGHSF